MSGVARIVQGAGALSLGSFVGVVSQLTTVPLALYAWGQLMYGEWVLVSGLVTSLKIADLGLQTFVVNRMTAHYARGERDEMRRVLHDALVVQIPLALLTLVALVAIVASAPVERMLHLQTAPATFPLLAALLAGEVLIGVPMGTVAGLYRATGRLARGAIVGTALQTSTLVVSVMLLLAGTDLVGFAAGRLAVSIVGGVAILIDLRRLVPWLPLWPASGTLRRGWARGWTMVTPGMLFLLIPMADFVANQMTLLIVQWGVDAAEVARLATHRTLVNSAVLLSGIFTNATWPELTAMEARGETARLTEAHRSFVKFNLWLTGGVALLSVPLIPLVYPSWTAGRLAVDDVTIALLVARTVVWAVWNASAVALMASNRHRPVVIALGWSSLVTVVLSFVCVPWMGIRGAAFGLVLGDLAIAAWAVPLAACRSVGDAFRRFAIGLAAAAWWGLAIPTAVGSALWLLLPTPWARYTVALPVAAACAATLMYTHLSRAEHRILDRLVSRRALAEVT